MRNEEGEGDDHGEKGSELTEVLDGAEKQEHGRAECSGGSGQDRDA